MSDNPIRKRAREILNYAQTEYPGAIGKMALRFIDDNFKKRSWEGAPWPARKRSDKNKKQRGLLVNTGRLRRSFHLTTGVGTVRVYTDTPYAKVHNEGYSGTVNIPDHVRIRRGKKQNVKAHERKAAIPARTFMPGGNKHSKTLEAEIRKKIEADLIKLLK